MDVGMIGGAISGMQSALGIAKSMLGLSEDVAVKMKAAELLSAIADVQGKLLEAQQAMAQIQDELRLAKEELARRADFDRYELCEPYKGTRLYRLKESRRGDGEPSHFICPNCRDGLGKLSILQEGTEFARCQSPGCDQLFRLSAPLRINHGGGSFV